MDLTIECPRCKKSFQVAHQDLAKRPDALTCCLCGNTPPPNIMEAYQNIGKTLTELQGCCTCPEEKGWLPKAIK